MRTWIKVVTVLHLLLCQHVCASQYSILENRALSVVNDDLIVLEEYLGQFNKAYVQINEPRQVVVLGASNPGFQLAINSLLGSSPLIICTDVNLCGDSNSFIANTLFIVIVVDLSDETYENNSKILSSCTYECRLMYLLFNGISNASVDEIFSYLVKSVELRGPNSELVHFGKDVVTHYGLTISQKCRLDIDRRFVWRPGTDFSKIDNLLFQTQRDFHGCPISVGTYTHLPEIVIEETKDGPPTLTGGRDGTIVTMVAKALNFTIVLKQPNAANGLDESRTLNLLNDIESGIVEFIVGRFRPVSRFRSSVTFGEECITFAVPRRMTSVTDNILWEEFRPKVWIMVGFVFVIGCVLEYTVRVAVSSLNGNQRNSGFVSIVIDVVSIHLGMPVTREPVSASGRFTFVAYLCYAVVITTAYKTSLSSILTAVPSSSFITDVQGIIKANLKVGGSLYHRLMLTEQTDVIEGGIELVERYEVVSDDMEAVRRRLGVDQDFAYLDRRSALRYERSLKRKDQQYVAFDILDECVFKYSVSMLFRNESYLLGPVNEELLILKENSPTKKFRERGDSNVDKEMNLIRSEKMKLAHILIGLICCLGFCSLVFFVELLVGRFK